MSDQQQKKDEVSKSDTNVLLCSSIEKAESLKIDHYVCDGDCWFSCPASGENCNDDSGDKCNCGADKQNKTIDDIVSMLKKCGT